ncbi:MAG: UDP-2,3-diacylglucosamine diphosphatase LpxI [Ancalomicrobiaceae bacterium]|nr:UDP-2,3-diacylglucosamine diphosphatase LpxI [Ancalomicrobiaceae bacterium]
MPEQFQDRREATSHPELRGDEESGQSRRSGASEYGPQANAAASTAPLGILAGGGDMPLAVAEAARALGRPVTIVGIKGEASAAIASHRHAWIGRGQLGTLFRLLRRDGIRDLVLIGGIRQRRMPQVNEFDLGGLWHLVSHLHLLKRGDDGALRMIARLIESGGFRVVGAADVAPELTAPAGFATARAPDSADWGDILAGYDAARAHGAADRGQAVIVRSGTVVLREGRDGTDGMLATFAARHAAGASGAPSGVLVKCLKPMQDRRLDMPTIGPPTVKAAAAAGLAGIAVTAHGTLVADRAGVMAELDRTGLFLVGLDDDVIATARAARPNLSPRPTDGEAP